MCADAADCVLGDACREQVNRVLSNTGQIKSELARCLLAEFLGTLLFQIFGGAAPPKDTTAPAANGFALVCISKYT
jgi:aquaporin TIP